MEVAAALKQFRKLAPPGFKPVKANPVDGQPSLVELIYAHNDGRLWMLKMNLTSGALHSVATKNNKPQPRIKLTRRRHSATSATAA